VKLAIVEWYDVYSATGHWANRNDLSNAHTEKAISVGILYREDNKDLTICTNLSGNQYSQTITIPKGCIDRIRYLKVK